MSLTVLGASMTVLGVIGAIFVPVYARVCAGIALVASLCSVGGSMLADVQRDQKTAEVDALHQELSKVHRQFVEYTRGTGGYIYFEPTVSSERHTAIGALIGVGDNPLYDVRARIVPDPEQHRTYTHGRANFTTLEHSMKVEQSLDVGTVTPGNMPGAAYPSRLVAFDLGLHEPRRAFDIVFSTRNDQLVQSLRFKRVGTNWFYAYRVSRQRAGEEPSTLKEVVQPGYPLEASGHVDWRWDIDEE